MTARTWLALLLAALLAASLASPPVPACAPAFPSGKPVVNADQTVIIIWDAATKTQHFIRRASFQGEADDFGFLVPTPSRPTLDESGDEAFPYLLKLTEPETQKAPRSGGLGCSCESKSTAKAGAAVRVLEEKTVAGLQAAVLEADSTDALVAWLKEHGYAFSPEVQAWARPYVESGWKITALRVAKDKAGRDQRAVAAASLRLSFQTDRPLFPYREPDPTGPAAALGAGHRLLRIYFLAEARYRGELTREVPWTGRVAWANRLASGDRARVLDLLKLPAETGPAEWWLTEFEDDWPYRAAPADVYFARDPDQDAIKRPPVVAYFAPRYPTDATTYALVAALVLVPLLSRYRRWQS
jgi:Uncharacterized protein conserved in bacteria (DUF2330)